MTSLEKNIFRALSQDKDNLPVEEQPKEAIEMKEPETAKSEDKEEVIKKNNLCATDSILAKLGVDVAKFPKDEAFEVTSERMIKICNQALAELEKKETAEEFTLEEIEDAKTFFISIRNDQSENLKEKKNDDWIVRKLWIVMMFIELLNDPFFKATLMGTWLLFLIKLWF